MVKAVLFVVVFYTNFAWSQNLKLFVTLNPAGDFVAESSQVSGEAVENADGTIQATNIKLPVKSLSSGITLRDEHMINKYFEAAKYPEIILKIAKGKEGKGEAILIVKGKQGKVSGSYMKGKEKIKATFPLKLSTFGIESISYKGIGVEDEAKVEVIVPLKKAGAASSPVPAKSAAKKK